MKNFAKLVAVATLIASISSCAKEVGVGSANNGETSVKIQVAYPKKPDTRAESGKIGYPRHLSINNGHVFFVSKDNVIKKHIGVDNTAGSVSLTRSQIEAGEAVINNVPASIADGGACYIVANFTENVDIKGNLENENITQVLDKVNVTVDNLNSVGVDDGDVMIYGSGPFKSSPGTTQTGNVPYQLEVVVPTHTVASRLQIGAITGVDHLDGTKITSFTAKAIFINHTDVAAIGFWENYFKNGTGMKTSLENGQSVTDYTLQAYKDKNVGSLAEDLTKFGATANTPASIAPGENLVWGYYVLCKRVPHILIHFSEVKIKKSSGSEQTLTNKFITMRNFKYAKEENGHVINAPVTEFLPDNVYTLDNIEFNYTHLGEPEEQFVDALVSVTPAIWKDNSIYWTGN
jgi:hypothetical protein